MIKKKKKTVTKQIKTSYIVKTTVLLFWNWKFF